MGLSEPTISFHRFIKYSRHCIAMLEYKTQQWFFPLQKKIILRFPFSVSFHLAVEVENRADLNK